MATVYPPVIVHYLDLAGVAQTAVTDDAHIQYKPWALQYYNDATALWWLVPYSRILLIETHTAPPSN